MDDEASLRAAVKELGLPAVLKTRTLGYDGHGQLVLKTEADIERALPLLAVPCILEEFVRFDFEASIVMVADAERVVSFPVGRNIHRDGILDLCIVPAETDPQVLERMKAESERFMRDCGYRGILAIEYFIRDGEIYFNEMAPRPHNSGHYTIEGSTTNQFRELVRYLVGEPLAGTAAGGAHGDEEHPRTGPRGGRKGRCGEPAGRLRASLRQDGVPAQTQDGAHHVRRDDRRGV